MNNNKNIKPETKRFRSRNGQSVCVSLPSGHVAHIGPEYQPIPKIFWAQALHLKCVPEDFDIGDDEPIEEYVSENETLIRVLTEMVAANEEGDFTASGLPNLKRLQKRAGWNVTREELGAAWHEMHKDSIQSEFGIDLDE